MNKKNKKKKKKWNHFYPFLEKKGSTLKIVSKTIDVFLCGGLFFFLSFSQRKESFSLNDSFFLFLFCCLWDESFLSFHFPQFSLLFLLWPVHGDLGFRQKEGTPSFSFSLFLFFLFFLFLSGREREERKKKNIRK